MNTETASVQVADESTYGPGLGGLVKRRWKPLVVFGIVAGGDAISDASILTLSPRLAFAISDHETPIGRSVATGAAFGLTLLLNLVEPTSSLGVHSERPTPMALDSRRSRTTTVIIAHHISTLDIRDRIMALIHGVLRAFDTPDNLEESNDFYRETLAISGMR